MVHPYLFEHHPRRFYWSFPRTILGALRPGRFWTALRPELPIRPRWLALFALLMAVVWMLTLVVIPSGEVVKATFNNWQQRSAAEATYEAFSDAEKRLADSVNLEGYVALHQRWYPLPTERAFWDEVWPYLEFNDVIMPALVVLAWPWLTLLALLIFRQSLRQARIRSGHLVRCCVYASVPLLGVMPVNLIASWIVWTDAATPIRTSLDVTLVRQFLKLPLETAVALGIAMLAAGW